MLLTWVMWVRSLPLEPMLEHEQRQCPSHGLTKFYKSTKYHWRCQKCNTERVTEHRRKNKRQLIEDFAGKCSMCGYSKCIAALEFHHLDPSKKDFGLSSNGITGSLKRMRAEAAKCILVCCRCHREIHASMDSKLIW